MDVQVIKEPTPIRIAIDRNVRALLSAKLQLDVTQIAGAAALSDLGFDSLALSDLAEAIEERFDMQVPNRMLPASLTIDQLVALLGGAQKTFDNMLAAEPAD
jgi:acyl carrier protein